MEKDDFEVVSGIILQNIVKKEQLSELVRNAMTEMKKTGELHRFEDEVERGINHSAKYGKLNVLQAGAVTELQKKKKKTEVKNELEKRMNGFTELDRRIAQITESSWMRQMVYEVTQENVAEHLRKRGDPDQEQRSQQEQNENAKRTKLEHSE